jgi:hypothetical protein
LKNHFGHLAIQMTEVYGSWDDDLVSELFDAEVEHDYEALDQILSSDRLAGKLGERIATRNQRFRGLAGVAARAEYIDNIKSDPLSDRLSLVRHDYGFCVLEAESAACGLDAWRVGPPTCAPCKNLVVTEAHAPYWRRIGETLNDDLRGFRSIHLTPLTYDRRSRACPRFFQVSRSSYGSWLQDDSGSIRA